MTRAKKASGDTGQAALRAFALSFPGAVEEFPWGERVVKVDRKVFVFLGHDADDPGVGIGVKLPFSASDAVDLPWCAPSGYGLGKSGWVSVKIPAGEEAPMDLLRSWIDESYRAVAKKKRIKELDAQRRS